MKNNNLNRFGVSLITLAFSAWSGNNKAFAQCAQAPSCESLGFTVSDQSLCGYTIPILKCPFDTTKVYCIKKPQTCRDTGPTYYNNPPTGYACKKVTKEGLVCYTSCTKKTCSSYGYEEPNDDQFHICTGPVTTEIGTCYESCREKRHCDDFGHYGSGEVPKGVCCTGSVDISLLDGTIISCHDIATCSPCDSNSSTSKLTEAQCRAKYNPQNRCGSGCYSCGQCMYPAGMEENNPECTYYSNMQDCTCLSW